VEQEVIEARHRAEALQRQRMRNGHLPPAEKTKKKKAVKKKQLTKVRESKMSVDIAMWISYYYTDLEFHRSRRNQQLAHSLQRRQRSRGFPTNGSVMQQMVMPLVVR